jgi:hypothetical protein
VSIEAFPLQWPAGWTRTNSHMRESGQFSTTLAGARDGLMAEISRMGGRMPVLSSNLNLRKDGMPYAQQGSIEDPGIAVYFTYKGKPMCFACDRYKSPAANTQAVRKTIEAIRGIERWGASDMMERAFTGFAQLDAPANGWRSVLDPDDPEGSYRRLRKTHHPDHGGSSSEFHAVQEAYSQYKTEVSANECS